MTFHKPKYNKQTKPVNAETTKKVLQVIADDITQKNEKAVNAFSRLDESMSKYLSNTAAYYYFLLSITTACIGFTITLTIHEKFIKTDFLIIISLILWMVSFNYGLQSVNRTNKMIMNHNLYVLGEMGKYKEISEPHKKMLEELGKESAKTKKSPLLYLLIGIFFFIIWYIIKLCTN